MNTPTLRERDLSWLRQTFHRFPWVSEVRVFGSRATGTARRSSDIDLAISAPEATPNQWQHLVETLESAPIIYELDVVRIDQTLNPRLNEKILREGLRIYPESSVTAQSA